VIATSDFKKGIKILFREVPYMVLDYAHVKPGKGGAFVRTKMKNLLTGLIHEETFRSGEKFPRPDLEYRDMQYLYSDAELYYFMDKNTFEQHAFSLSQLSGISDYLKEQQMYTLMYFNNKVVAANPPTHLKQLVDKKIASAKLAQEQFPAIIEQLTTNIPNEKEVDKAEIRFYKGKAGVVKIYKEALAGDELRLYVNLTELEKMMIPNTLGFDYAMFENALKNNPNLKIYEIVADTPGSVEQFTLNQTAEKQNYRFKFIPNQVGLTSPGILLYDNKVAIISGKDKAEMIVLNNKDYYINSKKIFDFIWGILPGPAKE